MIFMHVITKHLRAGHEQLDDLIAGYDAFENVRTEFLENENLDLANDYVFETAVGDSYGQKARRKLMLIGKAPEGWGCPDYAIQPNPRQAILEDFVQGNNYRSLFWGWLNLIGHAAGLENYTDTRVNPRLCRSVAWSNLLRISEGGHLPRTPGFVAAQSDISIKLLRLELNLLQPSVVSLVSSGGYEDVANAAFGPDPWEDINLPRRFFPANQIAEAHLFGRGLRYRRKIVVFGKTSCEIFWTRHPQGWRREWRDHMVEIIGNALR